MKWDKCICERDSDGDGRTNGEELGDPDCLWPAGGYSVLTNPISHPGVCEPIDDPICMQINDWSFCEDTEEFVCDTVDNNPDLKVVDLRFDETPVPAKETSYYCKTFDLPDDAEYHLIANEPIVDNAYVMHHLLLFGCDVPDDRDDSWRLDKPAECGMSTQACQNIIGVWTIGVSGQCLPQEYGFPVGINGFKTVLMQIHWNNPMLKNDYTDNSGLKLYLSKTKRPNIANTLLFGGVALEIPPRMESVTREGFCHSQCTEYLPHPVYIKEVMFHMHYLGYSGAVEHIRDGQVLKLIEAKAYNYDNPDIVMFDQPLEFLPGDELKLTCNFKSTSKSYTTYFGEGTSDEMCYAFVTYYPSVDSFNYCASYKTMDVCPADTDIGVKFVHPNYCNFTSFMAQTEKWLQPVLEKCYSLTCTPECREVAERIISEQPCLQGDMGEYTQYRVIAAFFGEAGKPFVEALHVCDDSWDRRRLYREEVPKDPNETIDKEKPHHNTPEPEGGHCVFDPDISSSSALGVSLVTVAVGILAIMRMI